MYHLTLLRHGQSEGNIQYLFQGQEDYPLSELGRKQAQALATRWKSEKKHFDLIITSPLSRARDTARAVADALDVHLEEDPKWMEQDFGDISHRNIREYSLSDDRPSYAHPYLKIGTTGESRVQLIARAGAALEEVISHPEGQYLIVAHGAVLNMALYHALAIPAHPNIEGPRFLFRNTSFATLTYQPEQHIWGLEGVNDERHLNAQQTSL